MNQTTLDKTALIPDAKGFFPPCKNACPINQDARQYLGLIASGRFSEALAAIKEVNPLPASLGIICAHPCETKCRRGKCTDGPLSIRALKRFAVENGKGAHRPADTKKPTKKEKIAIIGGGPAGLTAANDLAKAGYPVTVFDREKELGGVFTTAIPIYRLPRTMVQQDVAEIMALGVEFKGGMEIGKNLAIPDLKAQGYKAILVAVGMSVSRGLNIPGVQSKNVVLALPFLKAVNYGQHDFCKGRRVVVVGGGNVAVDVARSALRSGATHVQMVCLESDKEMPAFPWEIQEAKEEGIDIRCSTGPKRILEKSGSFAALEGMCCVSVFDAQGKFNPSYREDDVCTIEGDMIILAIGQGSDLSWAKANGLELNQRGLLVFNPRAMTTSQEGVFACGEVVTGPGTAVQSMANARLAAQAIVKYIEGQPLILPTTPPVLGDIQSEVLNLVKANPRNEVPILSVTQRATNFNPVELGFGAEDAVSEARRCLHCGAGASIIDDKCCACLTCLRICPYKVPVINVLGDVVIRADQCQACGLCVQECPAKAISFSMPGVEEIPERLRSALTPAAPGTSPIVGFCCSYNLSGLDTSPIKYLKLITVPCVAKIGTLHLLKAFELGASGALVLGCEDKTCSFQKATDWAQLRVEAARKALTDIGLEPERLAMFNVTRPSPSQLAELVGGFKQKLESLNQGAKK